MRRVGLDELLGDVLRSVGRAVVDDDEFPVNLPASGRFVSVLPPFPPLPGYKGLTAP